MVGIYKLYFNNYIYIGKSVNIESRIKRHLKNLETGEHCNLFLQRLFLKNKVINWDIVEECSKDELNNKEIYWINYYKDSKDIIIMNMSDGGDGGNTFKYLSKDKKDKIIECSRKNGLRKRSTEEIQKSAENRTGQKRTEEQKRNISLSHIGKVPWNKGTKGSRIWVTSPEGKFLMILKDKKQLYISNGYSLGRDLKSRGIKMISWNKGKTKFNDARIKSISEKMMGNTRCMTKIRKCLGVSPSAIKKTLHRFFIEGVNSILNNNYNITEETNELFEIFFNKFIEDFENKNY